MRIQFHLSKKIETPQELQKVKAALRDFGINPCFGVGDADVYLDSIVLRGYRLRPNVLDALQDLGLGCIKVSLI